MRIITLVALWVWILENDDFTCNPRILFICLSQVRDKFTLKLQSGHAIARSAPTLNARVSLLHGSCQYRTAIQRSFQQTAHPLKKRIKKIIVFSSGTVDVASIFVGYGSKNKTKQNKAKQTNKQKKLAPRSPLGFLFFFFFFSFFTPETHRNPRFRRLMGQRKGRGQLAVPKEWNNEEIAPEPSLARLLF